MLVVVEGVVFGKRYSEIYIAIRNNIGGHFIFNILFDLLGTRRSSDDAIRVGGPYCIATRIR